MEQFEVVLKGITGYTPRVMKGENGEIIIQFTSLEKELKERDCYFTHITEKERNKVKEWYAQQNETNEWAKEFLVRVGQAIQDVQYDYWISNIEPSVKDGKIYLARGNNVGVGFPSKHWRYMCKKYAPELGSRQAKLSELILWYALRIADGKWKLKYVAFDSSTDGNYLDAPMSSSTMECSGARQVGGYNDGQGNTYKIVDDNHGFAIVGGNYACSGKLYPVSKVQYFGNINFTQSYGTAVVVLTK